MTAGSVQQSLSPQHIGPDKFMGGRDGTINVTLCSKVNDGIDSGHQTVDQSLIADISRHKLVPVPELSLLPIDRSRVCAVRHQIQIHQATRRVLPEPVEHEISANKPGSTGHKELHIPKGCSKDFG